MKEFLITFHTHYDALCCMRYLKNLDKILAAKGYLKLIPVPREVSSSCGTALKIEFSKDFNFDKKYLSETEYDLLFYLNGESWQAIK